jgi:hypothetical protein
MLFEPLNFEVMIESGVVCRSLCSAVGKMRLHIFAYFHIRSKEIRVMAYILLKFAAFRVF